MRPISVIALTLLAVCVTGMLTYFSTSPTVPDLDLQCKTSNKLNNANHEVAIQDSQRFSTNKTITAINSGESGWNVNTIRNDFPLPTSVDENNFTIVILTYNRVDSLLQSLNHYSHFRNVHRILVIWNDITTDIPQKLRIGTYRAPVFFVKSKINQLKNRFMPREEIETQGMKKELSSCNVYSTHIFIVLIKICVNSFSCAAY